MILLANGTGTVVINDPAATLGQTFNVEVTGTDGTSVSGTAVNNAQAQFTDSGDSSAKASDFTATIAASSGSSIQVGSLGIIGPGGITGSIAPDATNAGTFDVQFNAPGAAANQTFDIQVTGTDGTVATGTLSSGGSFNFTPISTSGTAADYTATITLSDSQTVTVTSQGIASSASGGIAGVIVATGNGFEVQIEKAAPVAATSTPIKVNVTGNDGTSASGTAVNQATYQFADNTGSASTDATIAYTFTAASTTATASDFTALVELPDGTTFTATSQAGAGRRA